MKEFVFQGIHATARAGGHFDSQKGRLTNKTDKLLTEEGKEPSSVS